MKTKKTLAKRIKITGRGKLLRKHLRTGHLKRKWDAQDSHDKKSYKKVPKTHRSKFKDMLHGV